MRSTLNSLLTNLGVAGEFITYLWKRKRWWLIPLAVLLMLVGLVSLWATVSGVGPFIYTLF